MPATVPITSIALETTLHASPTLSKVTVAVASSFCGGVPGLARPGESALQEQLACDGARKSSLRVTRRQAAGAALVGVLLLAGANGLVMLGERTVPSGLAALIVASIPLWIVLLRLAVRERVGGDVIIGVTVGIVGVAVLVVPSGVSGQTDPLGLLMLVVAALSWASGTFASTRLDMPRDAFGSTVAQMVAAGIVLLAAGAVVGERFDAAVVSTRSLVAFAYLAAFGSLVAFSAYTWLLQNDSVLFV